MDLYNSIFRRKSCRSYTRQTFSDEKLAEIKRKIQEFTPLHPNLPLEYRFITKARGMFKIDAPHYLVVSGQGKPGEAENAGFIIEHLALWFDTNDTGCVWLGKTIDAQKSKNRKDLIVLAFGQSEKSVHRDISEFKRKPMGEITNDVENSCIKAVRLAPSGYNGQPWYLEKDGDRVTIYKHVLPPPISLAYTKTDVDMGIALCHYAVACEHFGKPFHFNQHAVGQKRKAYQLFGILET